MDSHSLSDLTHSFCSSDTLLECRGWLHFLVDHLSLNVGNLNPSLIGVLCELLHNIYDSSLPMHRACPLLMPFNFYNSPVKSIYWTHFTKRENGVPTQPCMEADTCLCCSLEERLCIKWVGQKLIFIPTLITASSHLGIHEEHPFWSSKLVVNTQQDIWSTVVKVVHYPSLRNNNCITFVWMVPPAQGQCPGSVAACPEP